MNNERRNEIAYLALKQKVREDGIRITTVG